MQKIQQKCWISYWKIIERKYDLALEVRKCFLNYECFLKCNSVNKKTLYTFTYDRNTCWCIIVIYCIQFTTLRFHIMQFELYTSNTFLFRLLFLYIHLVINRNSLKSNFIWTCFESHLSNLTDEIESLQLSATTI